MDREIRIKITPDGKVEIDSTVFNDCKEVANHLSNILGKVEKFEVKEEEDTVERIKLDSDL
ncbi:MAG: hypothetical protein V3T30_08000 [Thermodesulfobacteriota bacterium]